MKWLALLGFFSSRKVRLLESEPTQANFHEAVDLPSGSIEKKGERWEIVILEFGRSKRSPNYVYTRESAERSLKVFDGARIYALHNSDDHGHAKDAGKKSTRDIVGIVSKPRITESDLRAEAVIFPAAKWLRENLSFAEAQGLPQPYELSIDAAGTAKAGEYNGKKAMLVESLVSASVDVVERGAAGGKILKMVASDNNTHEGATSMKQKLLFLFSLLYPKFLESKKVDLPTIDENALFTHLLEADKPQSRLHLPDGAQMSDEVIDGAMTKVRESLEAHKDEGITKFLEALEKMKPPAKKESDPAVLALAERKAELDQMKKDMAAIRLQASQATLDAELGKSKLPKMLQEEVREQMKSRLVEGAAPIVAKDVEDTVTRVRKLYGRMVEATPNMRGLDIGIGLEGIDKVVLATEGMFLLDPNMSKPLTAEEKKTELKGVPAFCSLREAYIAFTGDTQVTGKIDRKRFTESVYTTDWTYVMANAMTKRLVREYGMMALDSWRKFVDIVNLNDFKTQYRIRYGGYANLPAVAQGAPYLPLTSPTDEQASYTPSKRGGTEDLTREMILGDDLKAAIAIPQRMARSAAQTLHQFVYDFICPAVNPTVYDSVALYYARTNTNTATTALGTDGVALAAARLRMKKQANKDNSKRLGIRSGFLVVPPDLEKDAYANLVAAYGVYNTVPTYIQSLGIEVIVVDYWTDVTDWTLVAKREDVVGLEIGFINGQETPEMFVSDIANVGSLFTNDKITYKIRHEYGGAITDYRAFDGSIVSG